MGIPTSRVQEKATIIIHEALCNGCGLCVSVCKDNSIQIVNQKVSTTSNPFFGCIGCGHCMAICPHAAIEIDGREIDRNALFDLPKKESAANFEQVLHLFQRRRSIREFKDEAFDKAIIDQILAAASNSPMGIPPSDVNVLVLDNQAKVRQFSEDYCTYLNGMKWFVSKWFLALMRPFWGKTNDALCRKFVKPLFEIYTGNMKNGINLVTYDAPLAMYFYGSPYSDPADPIVAATYAMIAGESLGLGSCMLGGIHPLIQNGKKAKKLREKYAIKYKSREGLFVIFGHPALHYSKGINRTFASITTI